MSTDEQGIQAELAALRSQLDRIEQALQEVLARLPKPFNAQEVAEAMLADMQRQERQPGAQFAQARPVQTGKVQESVGADFESLGRRAVQYAERGAQDRASAEAPLSAEAQRQLDEAFSKMQALDDATPF